MIGTVTEAAKMEISTKEEMMGTVTKTGKMKKSTEEKVKETVIKEMILKVVLKLQKLSHQK